jgi:hypothetical protein
MKYKGRLFPFLGYEPLDNVVAKFIGIDEHGEFRYDALIFSEPEPVMFFIKPVGGYSSIPPTEVASKWKESGAISPNNKKLFIKGVFNIKY